MKKPGKKYQEKTKLIAKGKAYTPAEAVQLVKKAAPAKFDESIDLAMKMGVDPKKSAVRGTVMLPAGSGKTKKVAVIAKPDKQKEAQDAGADVVGAEDLVQKISEGFLGFDVVLATPDMMGTVGKVGKILGTKGLMPNPKTGTVTFEIGKTVQEYKKGKVEFKMDKTGALHMLLGKVSFNEADLLKNFHSALHAIVKAKPSGTKGSYIQSITLSSSMGPAVKINIPAALEEMEAKEA
ncbi:MAG: 50S ribosomal protein L1 [Candidatus Margulisbacteria bacterium]|nr:50S ribosomal protein L1 [Candidatus Margulisiibacteriota bacterium]